MSMTAKSAALFLCMLIFSSTNQVVQAKTTTEDLSLEAIDSAGLIALLDENIKPNTVNENNIKNQITKHKIKKNETLIDIAKHYKVSWKRIFYKNLEINDPNILEVNQQIIIPNDEEKLKSREIIENNLSINANASRAAYYQTSAPRTTQNAPQNQTISYYSGSSSGNTYVRGYCTYYAKQRRPDLPNNLGNANTWVSRASSQGIPTGSTPRVGAIGQQGMHVVYIEKVNSDGTVATREMNYKGLGIVSSRTVPASYFTYIY